MARKVTYEDLERLQEGQAALQEGQAALEEGQSALAAKLNELQGSLTKIETMLELGFQSLDSVCLSIGPVIGLSLPLHWTSHWTQPASVIGPVIGLSLPQ